jgi:glycosyltransferase involved in cell wall biosynthesis
LFEPNDTYDLIKKITELCLNEKKRDKFGKNGRREVLEKYDIKIVSKKWLSILDYFNN